jgi:hypothetical protein
MKNESRPEGTVEKAPCFHRPFRTKFVLDDEPGTVCRANFHCSFRAFHFPIQNWLKMESSRSFVAVFTGIFCLRQPVAKRHRKLAGDNVPGYHEE